MRRIRLAAFVIVSTLVAVVAPASPSEATTTPTPNASREATSPTDPGRHSGAVELARLNPKPQPHLGNGRRRPLSRILLSPTNQVTPAGNFNETSAAFDPTNHSNLIAGANDYSLAASAAAFRSADGGNTWNQNYTPLPNSSPNTSGGDPSESFDANGSLYYSYLSMNSTSQQLVISRSADKGATWGTPVQIETSSNDPDKPLMVVDQTSGLAFSNRKYVGYNTASATNHVIAHSDDGTTWSKAQVNSAKCCGIGMYPVVDRNGVVYVAWYEWDHGIQLNPNGELEIMKSTDGGVTFTSTQSSVAVPAVIAGANTGSGVALNGWYSTRTQPARKLFAMPSIDVDRTITTPTGGNLYVAWNDVPSGQSRMHIYFSRSTNAGASWSSPVQLDLGNPNDGWEPTVAVDQLTGTVKVAWYDRRDDAANQYYSVYYTQSTDGGQTFLPQQLRVTTHQGDPSLFVLGTGDYMQMVSIDGTAHPVWVDTSNSTTQTSVSQVFTTSVQESSISQVCFGPPIAGNLTPHSVAIQNSDGTVWSAGYNYYGDLGYGTLPSDHSDVFGQTQGLPTGRAEVVSAGGNTGLAIMPGGAVWAWGGSTTAGGASTPYQVSGISNVITVAQGALALEGDGSVWTISGSTATRVSGLPYVVKIAVGSVTQTATFYALDTQGQVWAWGANGSGQLGNGSTSSTPTTTPARVKNVKGAPSTYLQALVDIAAGSNYALAVSTSGTVYAWGANSVGQLGTNSTKSSSLPVPWNSVATATAVTSSGNTSAALISGGYVETWGSDANGELGDGNAANVGNYVTNPALIQLPTGVTFSTLVGGGLYFLAITPSGALWAWGDNYWGNFGIGPGNELDEYNHPVATSMTPLPVGKPC